MLLYGGVNGSNVMTSRESMVHPTQSLGRKGQLPAPLCLFLELVLAAVSPRGIRINHVAMLSRMLRASFAHVDPLREIYVQLGSTPPTRTPLSHLLVYLFVLLRE